MNSHHVRRIVTVFVVPGLMFVAIVLIPAIFANRLPDVVARHWGLSGEPNGGSDLWLLVAFSPGLAGLMWASLIVSDIRDSLSSDLAGTVYFVEAIFVSTTSLTVWANLDIDVWEQAESVSPLTVLFMLGAATMAGVAGWALAAPLATAAGGSSHVGGSTDSPLPTVGLNIGQRSVWFGKAKARWFVVLLPVFLVAVIAAGGVAAVVLIAVGVLLVLFLAGRVTVDERGVTIGLGPWGWPRKLFPLDGISHAEVVDVVPMSYGGWGLRFKGRGDARVKALVVRGGPGMKLVRREQADIVVTVDDPEAGAGLVNDLLRAHGHLPPTEEEGAE